MKDTLRRDFPWLIVAVAAVLLSVTLGCPLRQRLGLGCPLCGISRAWLCALRLDLAGAFRFHPLWPLLPALPLLTELEHRRPGRSRPLAWGLGALALAVYLLRLCLRDPVIV